MKYVGMNKQTGRSMTDIEHVRQSITDILMTAINTRVMRRDYGSLLPALIDQPQNPALRLKIMSACYMAILRWEPRVRLTTITFQRAEAGEMHVEITGVHINSNDLAIAIPVR
ncbi:baseplate assembly protein [Photorhabdus laumondii subsp. laumondii]|uniref:Baseplate assembly protein n=1 Tax=Photorhabdus laumondii subsp. laumondii TaxID=141679 RepID=A0A6L9JNR0_PHOLM|nr:MULTISPECIES: GPW/gp25 family protein [Photorhabdus]AXG42673.1 baseplate assembly protein [Photorhabdus laumondii subsp. laumondii]MCC8384735.1 GPW/gp25 family protein [Photorhabdus laumondii]MCC8413472.1 GPW/gp25 family protein [Photorhabdus laumondii]NDK96482.1 baseplate assembly protein [Photorhabdus laumondii subsp. laumondii]NDL17945.1 baseplate assembly protein [Photorhabdus laumondii subsp. laumondii]